MTEWVDDAKDKLSGTVLAVDSELEKAGKRIREIVGEAIKPIAVHLPLRMSLNSRFLDYHETEKRVIEYLPQENTLVQSDYQVSEMVGSMDPIYENVGYPLAEPVLTGRKELPIGWWVIYGQLALEEALEKVSNKRKTVGVCYIP